MSTEIDSAAEAAADAFYDALMDRFIQRLRLDVSLPRTGDNSVTLHIMLVDRKTNNVVTSDIVTLGLTVESSVNGTTALALRAVRGY